MWLILGFPLWALLVELILFVVFVVVVQLECYGWSTLMFILSVLSVQFVMKYNLLNFVKESPVSFLGVVAGCLVCAILWAFYKWVSFLYKFRAEREEKLHEFHKSQKAARDRREENDRRAHSIRMNNWRMDSEDRRGPEPEFKESPPGEEETKTDYDYLSFKRYKDTTLNEAPSFRDYKSTIVAWAIFWLPSLIGTLLDDVVRHLMSRIIESFKGAFQGLSDRIVGNIPRPERKG